VQGKSKGYNCQVSCDNGGDDKWRASVRVASVLRRRGLVGVVLGGATGKATWAPSQQSGTGSPLAATRPFLFHRHRVHSLATSASRIFLERTDTLTAFTHRITRFTPTTPVEATGIHSAS
jgi:hypothetical protein